MKTTPYYCLVAGVCAVLCLGCATPPHVVEGPGTVRTADITTMDFAAKADEMVQSLLESSVLDKAPNQPPVIVVARISNYTGRQFDTDLLAKKIRVALNKSGKAVTDVTGGALRDPDFTLSGKIIESIFRYQNTRQVAYTFQLSLSKGSEEIAVWEDEKTLRKESERPAIGF